ncbi:MAG: NAD-dependent epimerase/dehydratase family protein [Pseudonocardiaceae bacterium]
MRALVTGAAGFIGSHLCEHLLAQGDDVIGVDAMTDYYDPLCKERNLARLADHDRFSFRSGNLLVLPLDTIFAGVDVVYHLAGQPGVRGSWGARFEVYLERNVLATQRVLEATRESTVGKVVFASSSSVYGDAEAYPTAESLRPQPVSPYGVTKLAAEHLCELYRKNMGIATASLRLFTVFGPRQRPDMAFARLLSAASTGAPFCLYGDGQQTRDFTYVSDVVTAMRSAALSRWTGVANIGGGNRVTMNQVLALARDVIGPIRVTRLPGQHGDVRHTAADTGVARDAFDYRPTVGLYEGLAAMAAAETERATSAVMSR